MDALPNRPSRQELIAVRDTLILALAKYAGQVITVEVGRRIVAEACMDVDHCIDPVRFGSLDWNGYTIRAERVAGLEVELAPLHAAYLLEVRPDEAHLPFPWTVLRQAERAGGVAMFTARRGAELVGLMRVRVDHHMHTSALVVSDDMFYVLPQHRGFLAVQLWKFAEKAMFGYGVREASFDSLHVTGAPRMAKFLGYRAAATRFVKVAHDASDYHHVPTRHDKGVAHGHPA
jgi:hypothetical protein